MSIKAIETKYNGYRFRSRLEARWAVFMDALGISYEYEPQGFILPNGTPYLPDFYLPHIDRYLEIKPCGKSKHDIEDPSRQWTDHPAFDVPDGYERDGTGISERLIVLAGQPGLELDLPTYGGTILGDNAYWWCECSTCGFIGIEFDGRSDRLKCKKRDWEKWRDPADATCETVSPNRDKGYNYSSPRLVKAFQIARQARFEHGDNTRIASMRSLTMPR